MRPVEIARQITRRRYSGHTELHWVPHANEHTNRSPLLRQEHEIVQPDLGDRDWASIDPMMVRSSKGVRHRSTPAMYFWKRTRSHVWCESQSERWELLWLDYGGQVERLWSQPLAVAFGRGSRLFEHWHVPDFLAQFTDGSYGLFDVRPADLIDDSARVQFEETAAVCETLGWHYRVLTGRDRRATANLDCLSASRHDRCLPTREMEALILEMACGGRPRGELCQIVSPECPPLACAWVDNMAWRRLLHVDLSAVFSNETVYTTSESAHEGRAA